MSYKPLKRILSAIHKKTENKKSKKEKILLPYEPVVHTVATRFSQLYKITESTCWEWQGRLDRYGYGSFKLYNKTVKAHRYSYELFFGAFDKTLHVLHSCDNPRCVNPQHLFLGTNADNIADKIKKGRSVITYHRLSIEERKLIKLKLLAGETIKEVANQFNLHVSTVRRLSTNMM